MKKKTKIISSVLGATALGGGLAVAAIAQSCQTSGSNDSNTEAITAIGTAIRSLATYNANGSIPENINEAALYNILQIGVRALTNVPDTSQITSINITNPENIIVSGTSSYTVTIAIGTLALQANNIPNGATTISNPMVAVTISNIAFENGVIITNNSTVSGLELNDPAIAIIQTAMAGLSSYNDPTGVAPLNANEAQLFATIVSGVRSIEGASASSRVTAITINNPSQSISIEEAISGSYTITITQGATTISADQLPNGDTTVSNTTLPLIISNISFSSGVISTTGSSISGLTLLSGDEAVVIDALFGLSDYSNETSNPDINQQQFLTSLNTVSGEGNVQSIRFSADVTAVTIADGTISVSIGTGTNSDNAFVVVYPNTGSQSTDGMPNVWSNVADGAFTITGITVNNGIITVPTDVSNYVGTYAVDSDATIGIDAIYGLRAATTAPNAFPNQLLIWNEIQQQLEATIGTVVILNSISISASEAGAIGDSIIVSRGGTEIIIDVGTIQIFYTPVGEGQQTFSNSSTSFRIGLTYVSNVIDTVTIPSVFATLSRSNLTRSITTVLNGTIPQQRPAAVSTLLTAIMAQIVSDITAISAVTITSGAIVNDIQVNDLGTANQFMAIIGINDLTLTGTATGNNDDTFTNTIGAAVITFTYAAVEGIDVSSITLQANVFTGREA